MGYRGYRETAIELPTDGEGCNAIFYQSTRRDDRTSDTVGSFRGRVLIAYRSAIL